MTANNESFRESLKDAMRDNPGWHTAHQLAGITCKYGHKHTLREIGVTLGKTQDVERYRAADGTTYYRLAEKNNGGIKA